MHRPSGEIGIGCLESGDICMPPRCEDELPLPFGIMMAPVARTWGKQADRETARVNTRDDTQIGSFCVEMMAICSQGRQTRDESEGKKAVWKRRRWNRVAHASRNCRR